MKFKGEQINKLSDMVPGHMYVFVSYSTYDEKEKAYAFVYLKKVIHEEVMLNKSALAEITYICDIINAPEESSEFKVYKTMDQPMLDEGRSKLYKLYEI
jgi:hypothetical protein